MNNETLSGIYVFITFLIFIIFSMNLEIRSLQRDVNTLIEGEKLQNEINSELIKRIYLQPF
jgi:hypothetical protein